ncbi:MAG: hypothetical protein E6Q97_32580 [Desulfurellales bacterium]|nr:MAG: hypothetical protein E6Q97_32580 [Desulfurellales bacterium]
MRKMGDGQIDPKKLCALLGAALEAQTAATEITSVVAEDIKEAKLAHGLNTRAFAMCKSIARLDQVKRIALLQAFDSYREILRLDDAPQEELLPDPPTQMRGDNG